MKTLIKGDAQVDVSTMLLFPRKISDYHGKVRVPVFGDKNSKTWRGLYLRGLYVCVEGGGKGGGECWGNG